MTRLDDTLALIRNNSPHVERFSLFTKLPPTEIITDELFCQLAEAIKVNSNMKMFEIDLKDGRALVWTERGLTALGEAIKNHPAITELEIKINRPEVTPNHKIVALLNAAISGNLKLQRLCLFIDVTEINFLTIISGILQQNTSLNNLTICLDPPNPGNPFPVEDWQRFAESLANKDIIEFSLVAARLFDGGIAAVANILSQQNNLVNLRFIDCGITHQSLVSIARILNANPRLKAIDFSDSALTTEGLESLAPSLLKLKELRMLNLSNTGLTWRAYMLLRNILRQLKVTRLDLSNNPIDDVRVFNQLKTLITNTSVEELIFQSDHFTVAHLRLLEPVLSNHRDCKLRCFTINIFDMYNMHEQANNILNKNPRLLGFSRPEIMLPFTDRQHLIRQRFIDYAVFLAVILNKPNQSPAINIRWLPPELKLIILNYVVSKLMGISATRMTACWKLILDNISLREWSHATRDSPSLKLFQTKSELTRTAELEPLDLPSAGLLYDELSGLDIAWIKKR